MSRITGEKRSSSMSDQYSLAYTAPQLAMRAAARRSCELRTSHEIVVGALSTERNVS
jgi:hypothetical protein